MFYVSELCRLAETLPAWTASLTDTPTLSQWDLLISWGNCQVFVSTKNSLFLFFLFCWRLIWQSLLNLSCMTPAIYYVSSLASCSCQIEDTLSPQRWRCWWGNKAPCPADTRQTDIRWKPVFCLRALLAEQLSVELRIEQGNPQVSKQTRTNMQSELNCFHCSLTCKLWR